MGRCDRDADLAQEREDTAPNEPVMRLLRDGTAASLRRWFPYRAELAVISGEKKAMWLSLTLLPGVPIADARLQARGLQRSYAKGIAELNFVMAGQPGWEPRPTSMERLARTARLDL